MLCELTVVWYRILCHKKSVSGFYLFGCFLPASAVVKLAFFNSIDGYYGGFDIMFCKPFYKSCLIIFFRQCEYYINLIRLNGLQKQSFKHYIKPFVRIIYRDYYFVIPHIHLIRHYTYNKTVNGEIITQIDGF